MQMGKLWVGQLQQYKDVISETIIGPSFRSDKLHFLTEPVAAVIGTLHARKGFAESDITDLSGGKMGMVSAPC